MEITDIPDRFIAERRIVVDDAGCWRWDGHLNATGYGQVYRQYRNHLAHRYVYELMVGPIPEGMELDHLCRVRDCVNPEHLEPVTREENWARHKRTLTHCRRGHEMDEENTYYFFQKGVVCRQCKACQRVTLKNRQSIAVPRSESA
jgi:HNH endonuclease